MSLGGLFCLRMDKKEEREKSFLRNGGILLEDLIASSNGKCNPIRNFSAEELIKATDNFHSSHSMCISELLPDVRNKFLLVDELDMRDELDERDDKEVGSLTCHMYKGSLDDRPIIVKRFPSLTREEDDT